VARITDAVVRVAATKQVVRADCYGNNAAVECPACLGYPVPLIALPGWQGSSSHKPAGCPHCGAKIYITDDLTQNEHHELHILNLALEPAAR